MQVQQPSRRALHLSSTTNLREFAWTSAPGGTNSSQDGAALGPHSQNAHANSDTGSTQHDTTSDAGSKPVPAPMRFTAGEDSAGLVHNGTKSGSPDVWHKPAGTQADSLERKRAAWAALEARSHSVQQSPGRVFQAEVVRSIGGAQQAHESDASGSKASQSSSSSSHEASAATANMAIGASNTSAAQCTESGLGPNDQDAVISAQPVVQQGLQKRWKKALRALLRIAAPIATVVIYSQLHEQCEQKRVMHTARKTRSAEALRVAILAPETNVLADASTGARHEASAPMRASGLKGGAASGMRKAGDAANKVRSKVSTNGDWCAVAGIAGMSLVLG